MELFKDGLSEGEGVGVGINFQKKIICGLCIASAVVSFGLGPEAQDLYRIFVSKAKQKVKKVYCSCKEVTYTVKKIWYFKSRLIDGS